MTGVIVSVLCCLQDVRTVSIRTTLYNHRCKLKNFLSSNTTQTPSINKGYNIGRFSFSSRHLLRFLLQSPNGYHVGLCSQTPFTFGDEDQVMICLQKVEYVFTHFSQMKFMSQPILTWCSSKDNSDESNNDASLVPKC